MISLDVMSKIWESYGSFYWKGLFNTIWLSVVAVILGLILGMIVASGRMITIKKDENVILAAIKYIIRFMSITYVEVLRATPLLVQVFVIYYGATGMGWKLPDATATRMMWCLIAVALNSGAYLSEIIRSGIGAVAGGQMEAARCVGMSHWQAMKYVILPQAVRNILPALCNEFVTIIKETSVLSMVGVAELMLQAQTVASTTYIFVEPYIIAALMYFIIVFTLSKLISAFERRLNRSVTR